MMGGNDKPQGESFCAFNLDHVVPKDQLLRDIDHVLDLSHLREHLAPYRIHTGRPSVDPELMICMLLIGYCLGIRSERQLYENDDDWGGGSRAVNGYLDALKEDGSSMAPAKKVSQTDPMERWTAVLGDTAYGPAEFLGWMVNEANIEPHVPVWEKGEHGDGPFPRSDFVFDEANDLCTCPIGKHLKRFHRKYKTPRIGITKSNEIKDRASKPDCTVCPMKAQCCPNTEIRRVTRIVHESAHDVARAVRKTPAYRRTRRQRKQVEMPFAHMKRILKGDRLRLRGLSGARDEFLLTAAAQNLRRLAKGIGTGPPRARETAAT